MVTSLTLSQSTYPIQKIINGDTLVIMTKAQADEINNIFDSQTKKIADLKEEIKRLKSPRPLNSFEDSLVYRLDLVEYWVYWGAVDNCKISYSKEKKSIQKIHTNGRIESFPILFTYPE